MTAVWALVGLGNPGSKYVGTRHNVGEMALDLIAGKCRLKLSAHRTGNQIGQCRVSPGGDQIILIKPNSFMNLSGGPVQAALQYFNVPLDNTVVLHDEIDIPFDTLRLKKGGGHGGHNGLRDIAKACQSPDFTRVRIGVGRPPGRQDVADFVLSGFTSAERAKLPLLLADSADAALTVIESGLLAAQQKFHSQERA
ncbi:aminoacyl-tRNA hydrolase [Canibacter sp. lx-45]|uniref:aminoacyl-tRNA hydrolase n=1 Tax=Canibacter zhuwentaonis TaxID=2837491 RepID=UPI001BDDC956|nr:aminoacyl-tRNA hydrolase [Canibacter zhuwentaonis]